MADLIETLRECALYRSEPLFDEAADYIEELREMAKSLRNDAWIMAHDVSNTELKLAEKNCDWVAFKCAFNAVMKARRAGLARHEAAQAMLAAAKYGKK